MSTAFFRMMAQRGDLRTFHEPFADLAAQRFLDLDGERLVTAEQVATALLRLAGTTPVFWKDTTEYRHAPVLAVPGMLHQVRHTFLVRDPRAAIASHYAINPGVTCAEIGYEYQFEIFDLVATTTGQTPIVIDAADLLARPAATVRAYCARAGIEFRPQALAWPRGRHPAWARTARWHEDVSDTTGFVARARTYPVTVDNDARLAGYYRHHRPFYERMRAVALVPAVDPTADPPAGG